MSNLNDVALASAEQAAVLALAPLAAELGITNLAGIKTVNDLYEAWIGNTRDVPLMSLLDMGVQAGAMTLDGKWGQAIAEFGQTKFTLIINELVQGLAAFGDTIASDPELLAAVANLEIMQDTIFPLIETITEVYTGIQTVIQKLEPYMPYIELIARALRIYFFPPEGTAFGNDSFNLAMKELNKIFRLLYSSLKTWIIEDGISVPVPEILLGLSEGILDPSYSLDSLVEDVLTENSIGDVNLNWMDANGDLNLMNISNFLLGDNPPSWAVSSLAAIDQFYTRYGVAALSWFSNYYENLLDAGLLESHEKVISPVKKVDIVRFSADILDLLDQINRKGYTDSTMLKIGCDKLLEDGAIVDYSVLDYDEKATALGGTSLRKRFYDLNNTINIYHDVLSVLIGEVRFNFSEKIPVIDFYEDTFSLQQFYEDAEHTEVSNLDPNVDIGDLYNTGSKTFHSAIINLALNGTGFEEIMYHPDYLNLSVDNKGYQGPPYLAGLFANPSDPFERDNDNKISTWNILDQRALATAENSSANIAKGAYYNKAFLDDSGYYVPNPLTTTNSSYRGYATELKTEIEADITAFKSANTYADWDSEDALRISDVSYNGEIGTNRLEALGNMSSALTAWNSHISGSTFTVSALNSYDTVSGGSTYYSRRSGNNSDAAQLLRAEASGYGYEGTKLGEFKAGILNGFAAAIYFRMNNLDSVRYIEIRSPYDILVEKLYHNPFRSGVFSAIRRNASTRLLTSDKDHSFLYSGTAFSRNVETRSVRVEVKGKVKRWWKKLTKQKTYKTVTTTYETGERLGTNPTFYLVNKNPIANVGVGDSLFFYGNELVTRSWLIRLKTKKVSSVLGFKVSSIEHFDMPTTVQVQIAEGDIVPITAAAKYIPGTACYVYKLTKLELNVTFDWDPFCNPYSTFVLKDGGVDKYRWNALTNLNSFVYKRGLPPEVSGHYKSRVTPHNKITVKALDKMLGSTTIANYIRSKIVNKPLIQQSSSDTTAVVTIGESAIIFERMARNANSIKNLPIDGSEVLLKYKTRWANYAKELDNLINIKKFTNASVQALDQLFGDTYVDDTGTVQDVPPWIEVNDESSALFVRETLFAEIALYMKNQLEGEGSGRSILRVRDEAIQGQKDSLYYQRYLVANQRMNKYSGPLYHTGSLEKSSGVLGNTIQNMYDKLEIIRYDLDALPITNSQSLVFINNKFIDSVKYDLVRQGIGDKCLLTCGSCLVKYTCPFYNEQEVLLTMLDAEDTFSVYLKDNELNLATKVIIDGVNRTTEFREYHWPYSEIDNGSVRIIDDLIDTIDEIQPTFVDDDGDAYDPMGWINKARYGTVTINNQDNFSENKYLYDALFIEDEESYFSYGSSTPIKVGDATISIKEANAIKAFSENDLIFLVSEDGYDPIYLGVLKDLNLEIQNDQLSKHYASAYRNLDDYTNLNQPWKGSYNYQGKDYVGRLNSKGKTELIGDGSFTKESVFAGKPMMRNYINFLREVKIPMNRIQWTLSGTDASIITAKKSLPFFKTNMRLVNVQR